jgi:hypothetical protein
MTDRVFAAVIAVLAVTLALLVNSVPAPIYGDCQDDLRAVCER